MKKNFLEHELITELESISGVSVSNDILDMLEVYKQYEVVFVKSKDYKDYNVFVPKFKNNPIIGYPYIILTKNGETRLSTVEESLEYLK